MVMTIGKPSLDQLKMWPWLLNIGGQLTGFCLQYFIDDDFRTSITGRLIKGGHLKELRHG